MNFASFLTKKESFFVENWRLLILFSIDNRFLTLNSWEKVLWTSKHHFWEVHFLWPKWNLNSKKMRNIISFSYYRFTMDDLVWNINNVSHFLHLKFHFGHKKWTSQKWCLEVHRTFSQEFGAKKRLSMVKIIRNCQFLSKNEWKKF